jgi:hypothetical protein
VVQDPFKKKIYERGGDSLFEACLFEATRLGYVFARNQFSFISAIEPRDKKREHCIIIHTRQA